MINLPNIQPHQNHLSDPVGTLNPNCPDCREMVMGKVRTSFEGYRIGYQFFLTEHDLIDLSDEEFDQVLIRQFEKAIRDVTRMAKEERKIAQFREKLT